MNKLDGYLDILRANSEDTIEVLSIINMCEEYGIMGESRFGFLNGLYMLCIKDYNKCLRISKRSKNIDELKEAKDCMSIDLRILDELSSERLIVDEKGIIKNARGVKNSYLNIYDVIIKVMKEAHIRNYNELTEYIRENLSTTKSKNHR